MVNGCLRSILDILLIANAVGIPLDNGVMGGQLNFCDTTLTGGFTRGFAPDKRNRQTTTKAYTYFIVEPPSDF
jgi:hypothetical protein